MKFFCSQQELLKKINIVSRAVSSRTTIPNLKGILLSLDDGKLTLTATDLDITIETSLFVDQKEPGRVLIPAKLFSDIIRKLHDSELEISEENNNVNIKCGTYNTTIVGFSGEEFPIITLKEGEMNKTKIDKGIFNSMIKRTAFAASVDQTKGIITGVLLEKKNLHTRMVALDGFRVALTTINEPNTEEQNMVISARLINEISKIISDSTITEDDLEIYYKDNSAIFDIEDTRISIRLLAGEFIKYKEIIKKDGPIDIKIKRTDLINAVDRASILSEVKNNLIKMSIKGNVMTISSSSEEGGSVEDIIIEKSGEDLDIGFNARYLIDALKVIDDEEINLKMESPLRPCTILPIDKEEYVYMVFPVRIN